MKDLYFYIRKKEIPIFNGFILRDGSICNVEMIFNNRVFCSYKKKLIKSHSEERETSSITKLNEIYFDDISATLTMGEGSYGSDGFIYLSINGHTEWLFFSDCINPIVNAKINEKKIIAINNVYEEMYFNIHKPWHTYERE